MGTDLLGRDMLSRVIYGGRVSISMGLLVQLAALAGGSAVGRLGGVTTAVQADLVVTRLVDFMMAFPSLLLALLFLVTLGPGYNNVLFAMAVVAWPLVCRLVRGQFFSLRESEFVLAAAGGWRQRPAHHFSTYLAQLPCRPSSLPSRWVFRPRSSGRLG